MKFAVKSWTLLDLYKKRSKINFPIYQRGEVWSEKKEDLLVDSIMRGIDIPKLYLQKKLSGQEWDCIDGHQRIKAIIGYFDGDFTWNNTRFNSLTMSQKEIFESYPLTITEVEDITEEEVILLFLRLQLGIPLNSGEKLNAINSNMNEFVKRLKKSNFIKMLSIPIRRFAKEQVCAQICNNSAYINKTKEFRNSKYEDLEYLYRSNMDFNINCDSAKGISSVIEKIYDIFGDDTTEIRNRASAVSLYLFIEYMIINKQLESKEKKIKTFYREFLKALQREVKLGLDTKNRWLIAYQSKIIQGADSKTAIEERHYRLKEAFEYYLKHQKIIGYE